MTGDEFIETFKEIIQSDMELGMSTLLADIEEWDSMGMMAAIAHYDARYSLPLTFEQLQGLETVRDLAALAPDFAE